jgi:AcrR family transcriptional regulator
MFVRDGYEGGLGEIAALAGRTKEAIYAHFKNKEEIFLALFIERMVLHSNRMYELLAESPSGIEGRADASSPGAASPTTMRESTRKSLDPPGEGEAALSRFAAVAAFGLILSALAVEAQFGPALLPPPPQ